VITRIIRDQVTYEAPAPLVGVKLADTLRPSRVGASLHWLEAKSRQLFPYVQRISGLSMGEHEVTSREVV
jgi:hypothetical protein